LTIQAALEPRNGKRLEAVAIREDRRRPRGAGWGLVSTVKGVGALSDQVSGPAAGSVRAWFPAARADWVRRVCK
jgi:hypothetical protein